MNVKGISDRKGDFTKLLHAGDAVGCGTNQPCFINAQQPPGKTWLITPQTGEA